MKVRDYCLEKARISYYILWFKQVSEKKSKRQKSFGKLNYTKFLIRLKFHAFLTILKKFQILERKQETFSENC